MRLGVLDWGIGGLFAVRHALRREPTLDVLYLSDSGNVPYGKQSRGQLARSVQTALGFLVDAGATQVLLACHSGSTVLPDVHAGVPIFGVVDGTAVPEAPLTLVIGGRRTIQSGAWRRALGERRVVQRIAQPLSAHVEAGRTGSAECAADLDRILRPARHADVVVLACTHYAALAEAIQARVPRAALIDPALVAVDRAPLRPGLATLRLFTTGAPDALRAAAPGSPVTRVELSGG
jgi:glutamate racemase